MKLKQKSNVRAQGMFFCIGNNQNETHFEEGASDPSTSGNLVHAFHTIWPSYLLAYMQPYQSKIICNIIPENEGGGLKAVWTFSSSCCNPNPKQFVQPNLLLKLQYSQRCSKQFPTLCILPGS